MMKMMSKGGKASWFLAALMAMNASSGVAQGQSLSEISEARAEQVEAMRARGEDAGIGTYGLRMMDLVASGFIEPGKGWKDPETATWTGQHGAKSHEAFLASEEAQIKAYAFYLTGAFEHISIQKPEIKVAIDEQTFGAKDVMRVAPYAKPHEIVDYVVSGDSKSLDEAAVRSGYENGKALARGVIAKKTEDLAPTL